MALLDGDRSRRARSLLSGIAELEYDRSRIEVRMTEEGTSADTSEKLTPICAIGASAGGVQALQSFFEGIDPNLGIAYVVIMHLSPEHESQMTQILSARTTMPVHQVDDSPTLEPDCVYLIAPDRELVIDGNEVRSRPFSEPRGQRAPIDMFFRSVAAGRGDGFCVVLSGAGSDGAVGVGKIKEAGGVVFVQDPREADFATMPKSAIATGVADFIEPIGRLVGRIAEVARSKAALRRISGAEAEADIRRIIAFLHARTGHDFSSYKKATVLRRITRRMQVARQASFSAYADYLRDTPEEAQELLGDLLISVTSFFRDANAYQALGAEVIAPLLRDREPGDGLRVWSVGCATGEEAYSLAILFLEEAERQNVKPEIQIFASDLDHGALATAREGLYPKAIEADVSEERLRRFFVDERTHYRIRKEVRDLVLFAHHSAIKDPPFMRLDLIACRNLLIYLDRMLQRQLLALFHYALQPNGFLFLGSAESIDTRPELFAPRDREARIFAARPRVARDLELISELPREHRPSLPSPPRVSDGVQTGLLPSAHASALEELAPPSVLVDDEHRVLNLSKSAGRFIRPPEGPLRSELPDMVLPELRDELRRSLHRALDMGEPSLTLPATVGFDGSKRRVLVHVSPVQATEGRPSGALVLFLDGGPSRPTSVEVDDDLPPESIGRIRSLEDELRATQERLSASRREHEGAMQELRVANEELQSINEEYRSTAEELETSKEELQSINEELSTVNSELKSKLDAVASAHSDLRNLVNSTEIGTLFLDGELRIKMLTPAVETLFNVTDSDIGRPITDFTHKLVYDGVERDAAKVLKELVPIEDEVETRDGRWLMMRLRPYRTVEDRIEGVVLSFVDISARRQTEARLRESEAKYRRLFETMDEGYLTAEILRDGKGRATDIRYHDANPAAERMISAQFRGRLLSEVLPHAEAHWLEMPARVAETGKPERTELWSEELEQWFDVGVTKIGPDRAAILFRNVTERKRHERERDLMLGELNHRVKNMLAVVQSIANQTLRSTDKPKAFVEAFGHRIRALAGAHALLTEEHWQGAELNALCSAALDSFSPDGNRRIHCEGPPVMLSPNATISFAMALHELGTNALKHGALSVPTGEVRVSWQLADEGTPLLHLSWNESGGPHVEKPGNGGFGRRMLERGISRELHGTVSLDYPANGFVCRMTFPLSAISP
jgi:two-component system CheB/CheR fusion protein